MKKLFLTIFCLVSIVGIAQVRYGVKAGVNASKVSNIHGDSNRRVGAHVGGFAQIPLARGGEQFFVQPEVLYSMMGEKNGSESVNLDYVSVPLLFKTYFSENQSEVFAELGPQFGFLVSKDVPVTEDYKSFDYGITAGLGYSHNRKWEATARIYYGLTDAESKLRNNSGENLKNANGYVNLGISYIF